MIVLDSHCHIYPQYDLEVFFRSFVLNTKALAPSADRALVLTERTSESFFDQISRNHLSFATVKLCDEFSLSIESNNESIYCFAGRQVASKENIEVLALGWKEPLPSGLPISELISRVLDGGSICVVPWSFGKWLGARGKLVKEIFNAVTDDRFFAGDIWGRHFLFGDLKGANRVLCGTDPLPLQSEGKEAGRFCSLLEGNIDPNSPWVSMKNAILTSEIHSAGSRLGVMASLSRQVALRI